MQRFQLYLLAVFVLCVGTCVAAAASAVSAEGAGTPGSGAVHGRIREFKLRHAGLQKGTVADEKEKDVASTAEKAVSVATATGGEDNKEPPASVKGKDRVETDENSDNGAPAKTEPKKEATDEQGADKTKNPSEGNQETREDEDDKDKGAKGGKKGDKKEGTKGEDSTANKKPQEEKEDEEQKDDKKEGSKGEDSTENNEPEEETTKQEDKEEGSSAAGGSSPSKPSSKPGQGGSAADGQASVKAGALFFVLSIGVALSSFL